MMKVSTKSTYAIRALTYLARQSEGSPVCLPTIAKSQEIPLPYLEQIFSKLRKAGLVNAVRGPQDGFTLKKSPGDISLSEIITALEGPLEPVLCSMPANRTPDCHDTGACMSRFLCNELDGELHRILKRNTLGSLSGLSPRPA